VNVGHALIEVGRGEEAVEVLERALAHALGGGIQVVASYARHNLGLALALVGRFAEGRTREEEAVVAFVQSEDRRGEGSARTYLAEILLATGDTETALREAELAAALLERFEPLLPRALAVLARARLLDRRLAAAREAAERALSLVEQTEEGERAVRLIHAEVLDACGEHEAARAAITKAEALLLARAADIADPALRRSFLDGVPENARTLALAAAWRG
jgi:tetratricopeptide (TPR) repeat protein